MIRQAESKQRQAASKQRQAISRYNTAARQHNAKVERARRDYNAAVRKEKREVEAYNRKARAHNARVRANQRRLESELRRLNSQPSSTRFATTQASTRTLYQAYQRVDVESEAESWAPAGVALADLAEAETANSAAVMNALMGDRPNEEPGEGTVITDELRTISEDLDSRWQGALFSLSERNPDAARHFCTSSREILTKIIDLEAPDDTVLRAVPGCQRTEAGKPTRREKIGFLLRRGGSSHDSLRDFIDTDVDDVMSLFRVFNDSTHGHAGALDLSALRALKGRVEGAIQFLSAVVRAA